MWAMFTSLIVMVPSTPSRFAMGVISFMMDGNTE